MKKYAAIIEATLAVVIWGVSFVATKYVIQTTSPNTVVWVRFAFGVMVLGITVVLRKQFVPVKWKDHGYFIIVGFVGITLHQWLQSNGLITSQATTTAWIVSSIPVFSALIGWMVLKEHLSVVQVLGILVSGVGVMLVVTRGDLRQLFQGHFGAPGDILILLSSPNWAIFSVISRRGLKIFPATLMMFFVMFWGWLLYWPLFLGGAGWTELIHLSTSAWIALLFLGIFSSGVAYVFWYDALQTLFVGQANTFVYLEPVITLLTAAIWLGERPGWVVIFGGVVVLVGVWLVNRK